MWNSNAIYYTVLWLHKVFTVLNMELSSGMRAHEHTYILEDPPALIYWAEEWYRLLYPEDGGSSSFVQNVATFPPYYTVTSQKTLIIIPYIHDVEFDRLWCNSSKVKRSYREYNICDMSIWLIYMIFNTCISITDFS